MLKIIKNPDKEKYSEVLAAIKANKGYCPCRLVKTADTKCMCKEFKEILNSIEEPIDSTCACGLYKIKD